MLFNIIGLYLFITIIASAFLASYVQSRNNSWSSRILVLLSLAVSIYMFGYVMETNATTRVQLLFWNLFQYFGIPFVSMLWLTIALTYTDRFSTSNKPLMAYVYLIPGITFLTRMTNAFHQLYFSSFEFIMEDGRMILEQGYGPWFYVQVAHSMSMVLTSLLLFVLEFIRGPKENLPKIRLMLLASLFAVLGLILRILDPGSMDIDYMVLCLPVTAVTVIIAVLRYDFLEIKTLARNMAFQNSHDAMLLVDGRDRIVDSNTQAEALMAQIGVRIREERLQVLLEAFPKFLQGLSGQDGSTQALTIGEETRYYKITTTGVNGARSGSYGWLKSISDVTESHRLNQELKRQATTDELSGLYNRRAFMELGRPIFSECSRGGELLHVMMMDLDHFKSVNDTFGHSTGDEIIRVFGHILRSHFREEDVVARLGGEEFAVILRGIPRDTAYAKAEGLRKKLMAHRRTSDDIAVSVTVSIGIACLSEARESLDQLLGFADQALYYSKEHGRNRTTSYESIL